MRDQITNDVSTCVICQTQKKQSKKYGLLPEKEAEAMPWDTLCVNLISPYNIKSKVKGVKIPPLKCVTMIDPATGWFECRTSVFMTLLWTHTSIHDITTKYPKSVELTI
jgi:hypothetical protein